MNKFIIANWKMNKTTQDSLEFINYIKNKNFNPKYEIVICPAFTCLYPMKQLTENLGIKLGAQNCHWEDSGAYTGEVSPEMLSNLKVSYVIVGHSERRKYFNETDEMINRKIKKAIDNNMKVILCVGEDLSCHEQHREREFILNQLEKGLVGLSKESLKDIFIAYEPLWAIGSGKVMNAEEAQKIAVSIKKFISDKYSNCKIPVIYGGSVSSENFKEFLDFDEIDGLLIGGDSLNAEHFAKIISEK